MYPYDYLPYLAVLIQPAAAVAAAAVGAAAAPSAAARPRPPNLEAANHQGLKMFVFDNELSINYQTSLYKNYLIKQGGIWSQYQMLC